MYIFYLNKIGVNKKDLFCIAAQTSLQPNIVLLGSDSNLIKSIESIQFSECMEKPCENLTDLTNVSNFEVVL